MIKRVNAELEKSPKIEVFIMILFLSIDAIKAQLAELETKLKGITLVTSL